MCFIERETQYFILKFRKIFRNSAQGPAKMKSDQNLFFGQIDEVF